MFAWVVFAQRYRITRQKMQSPLGSTVVPEIGFRCHFELLQERAVRDTRQKEESDITAWPKAEGTTSIYKLTVQQPSIQCVLPAD